MSQGPNSVAHMHEPVIGSEALASGALTRGALRWNYMAIYPDVYLHRDARIDLYTRAKAAWLWTRRSGVIAGRTAAALYGGSPLDDIGPIELIAAPRRAQPGVVVRNERIEHDEVDGGRLPLTTPARTALDLARRLPRDEAVVLLDKLSADTGVSVADVVPLQDRYRGTRGMGSARHAIWLMDGGSRSPEETRLRMALIDGGLPRPSTSIVVGDGQWDTRIGLGWADAKVAVEWAEHRRNLVNDVWFRDLLRGQDWLLIEAMPQDPLGYTIRRCYRALRSRWGLRR